jgi:UDP-glucose 4-epimerase
MTDRVLVTGGAGFIGSHLVEALLAGGYEPVVIDNERTGSRANLPDGVRFVPGDVRQEADLEPIFADGIDAVLHVAGQASIRLSFQDPTEDLSVNTAGTIRILQACVKYRVPRLIFASSMTIYGANPVVPTPEDTAPDPISYYAITKHAAERYVHATARRTDLDFDFRVTSMRMFNTYGPRQSLTNAYQGVFAIFVGNVLRGEPITIHSDGEQARDFVHVADVARAWVAALGEPRSYGAVINLGTGRSISVNMLCDQVLAHFGHDRDSYPVRYQAAQPGDMRESAADISRARDLLGWSPQVAFEAGIGETIAWARTQYSRD